ncbi:hypothetical protein MMC19_006610 [Ptychographa xylographoides]|nr:hypothetical protein [Ptychographa xylographoides]
MASPCNPKLGSDLITASQSQIYPKLRYLTGCDDLPPALFTKYDPKIRLRDDPFSDENILISSEEESDEDSDDQDSISSIPIDHPDVESTTRGSTVLSNSPVVGCFNNVHIDEPKISHLKPFDNASGESSSDDKGYVIEEGGITDVGPRRSGYWVSNDVLRAGFGEFDFNFVNHTEPAVLVSCSVEECLAEKIETKEGVVDGGEAKAVDTPMKQHNSDIEHASPRTPECAIPEIDSPLRHHTNVLEMAGHPGVFNALTCNFAAHRHSAVNHAASGHNTSPVPRFRLEPTVDMSGQKRLGVVPASGHSLQSLSSFIVGHRSEFDLAGGSSSNVKRKGTNENISLSSPLGKKRSKAMDEEAIDRLRSVGILSPAVKGENKMTKSESTNENISLGSPSRKKRSKAMDEEAMERLKSMGIISPFAKGENKMTKSKSTGGRSMFNFSRKGQGP